MYAKSYRVWKGFFGKLQNIGVTQRLILKLNLTLVRAQVNMALQKWKATSTKQYAARPSSSARAATANNAEEKFDELEAIVRSASHVGAFTSATRLVSSRRGRGWFLFRV